MAKHDNDTEDFLELEDLQAELAKVRAMATVQAVAKMVETLSEAVESLNENKEFYDKDLGKNLSGSLDKLSESLKEAVKPQDLSEITKSHESFIKANEKNQKNIATLIADVSNQNKQLVESISKLAEKPNDDSRYQAILSEVLGVVKKSNDLLAKGVDNVNYTKVLERISDRPKAWKLDVFYVQGSKKIDHIIATVINPENLKSERK